MNPVIHWQILAQDPEQAAHFYSQLFDWKISRDDSLQYRRVSTGQDGIDGGIWPVDANTSNFVQLYVQVPDVPAAIERACELGASVVMPHQVLPDGDEMAILVDPAGMSFGLSRARD